MRSRRGGAILVVLLLVFALLVITASTVAVVASNAAALERDYRGSQARALAEAALARAEAAASLGQPAKISGNESFPEGEAAWRGMRRADGIWDLTGEGSARGAAGVTARSLVRATLERRSGRWLIRNWREEQVQ